MPIAYCLIPIALNYKKDEFDIENMATKKLERERSYGRI
ncbi:Hypothetical protein Ccan_02490 [Capnocytophaga canimorsus Cc5]|uniref:Uncharacterized protein n=1 Tax=Capnocytophaga canimorsus (strain 5) TaxID=860228 RepID=F9YQT4_CAPCC|nr:Hypothetical protein Ccan_02490 [Capnocytophaga canimorsus Cc5]